MNNSTYTSITQQAVSDVVEKLFSEDKHTGSTAISHLLSELINRIMVAEREIYLSQHDISGNNKANGYYPRSLNAGSFRLGIDVPRVRSGYFRPHILPEHYSRNDSSYVDLLVSLIINGYSPSQISATLRSLGLSYSEKEMEQIKEDLNSQLLDFRSRPLPQDVCVMYIDGYCCTVKSDGKIFKGCCYVVVGVDTEGIKDIYGFYTTLESENKVNWIKIFNDLIARGLKRPCLIVSDDFSGLKSAIGSLFPQTDHQLCLNHLQRNVRRNMGGKDSSEFNKEIASLKLAPSKEFALCRFTELCDQYKSSYPAFIKHCTDRAELYFSFLDYPGFIRKHITTTNSVESINSRIEKARWDKGGFFQSPLILDLNIFLFYKRIKSKKWAAPIPAFRASMYEIKQLFNLKFNNQTQDY